MDVTLPAVLNQVDMTTLLSFVIPVLLFVIRAKFPVQFAAVAAILAKYLIPVGPTPTPTPTPAPTPAPSPLLVPDRPLLSELLRVLLPLLIARHGTDGDPVQAVVKEIAAATPPPLAATATR